MEKIAAMSDEDILAVPGIGEKTAQKILLSARAHARELKAGSMPVKAMKHQPERTCIGCRGVFKKDEVVRIVAGPDGIVIDYREKLPGRAAYVCPTRDCIEKALSKGNLSRALEQQGQPSGRARSSSPGSWPACTEKVRSLIVMAAKAGKLAAGYSAVHDAVEKGRVKCCSLRTDLSDGHHGKDHGLGSRVQSGRQRCS